MHASDPSLIEELLQRAGYNVQVKWASPGSNVIRFTFCYPPGRLHDDYSKGVTDTIRALGHTIELYDK